MKHIDRSSGIHRAKLKKGLLVTFIVVLLIISILLIADLLIENTGSWRPEYAKIDLGTILEKKELSESDYHKLFLQTGLGRIAVDELLKTESSNNLERTFEQYQNDFFSSENYECRTYSLIVHEERLRDKDGNLVMGFDIPSLRNGDIFITKSTHTLGWRHGHAAIVTNASEGEVLEAIRLGNPTVLQDVSKWETYPSFILLRLKNDSNRDAEKAAAYAHENFLDIPYRLFTGIPQKAPNELNETQCAHLIWYPYNHFGYDLDSDGSWLVTPKDVANSDLLEVVQVYGVNPEELWK